MKPLFVIAGERGSGKTTFLLNLIAELAKLGLEAGGLVSLHHVVNDSYVIRNLKTRRELLLMQRVAAFDRRPNHFRIIRKAEQEGCHWLHDELESKPGIFVIDEIGGYELSGKLWAQPFAKAIESPLPVIFTVKEKHLSRVVKKWGLKPDVIFYPQHFGQPREAASEIFRYIDHSPGLPNS